MKNASAAALGTLLEGVAKRLSEANAKALDVAKSFHNASARDAFVATYVTEVCNAEAHALRSYVTSYGLRRKAA